MNQGSTMFEKSTLVFEEGIYLQFTKDDNRSPGNYGHDLHEKKAPKRDFAQHTTISYAEKEMGMCLSASKT